MSLFVWPSEIGGDVELVSDDCLDAIQNLIDVGLRYFRAKGLHDDAAALEDWQLTWELESMRRSHERKSNTLWGRHENEASLQSLRA